MARVDKEMQPVLPSGFTGCKCLVGIETKSCSCVTYGKEYWSHQWDWRFQAPVDLVHNVFYEDAFTTHHISASSAVHILTRSWILYGVLERREREVLRTVGREPPDRKTCIFIFPGAILQPCVEKLRCKSFCPVSEQVPSCKDANSIG